MAGKVITHGRHPCNYIVVTSDLEILYVEVLNLAALHGERPDRQSADRHESYLRESLGLAKEADDPVRVAHAVYVLGLLSLRRQDLETARSRLEEALSLFLQVGNAQSTVSSHLDTLSLIQGDPGRAAAAMEEGPALPRKLGDRLGISNGLYNLAQVA